MVLEGRVVNGVVVLDDGTHLPEGARVRLKVVDDVLDEEKLKLPDASLPPDHPLAPYNREVELTLLRKRIEATKAGLAGIPLEEARARLTAEFGSPDEDPE
jgi:hypothetical protein